MLFLAFLLTVVVGSALLLLSDQGITFLLCCLAAAIGLWIFAIPSRTLVLFAFLIPLDVYLSEKIHITSDQLIQIALLLSCIFFFIYQGRRVVNPLGGWPRIRLLVFGWSIYLGLSLLWSIAIEPSWRSAVRNLLAIGIFWVVLGTVRKRAQMEAVTTAICLGAAAVTVYGLVQYWRGDFDALYPFFSPYYNTGIWTARGGGFSVVGTFANPNMLAAFGVMVLPLMLGKIANSKAAVRILWILATVGLSVTTLLSFSKNGWIVTFLVFGAWGTVKHKLHRKRFVIPLVLVTLSLPLYYASQILKWLNFIFPNTTEVSTIPRMRLWQVALEAFVQRPFVGYGLDGFTTATLPWRGDIFTRDLIRAHDLYLQTLVDSGVVGFVLFFGTIASIVVAGVRLYRGMPSTPLRTTLLCLLLSTGAFFGYGIFEAIASFPACLSLQWVILGLLVAAVTIHGKSKQLEILK